MWQVTPGQQALDVAVFALEAGFRHIDTAQSYKNEADVGEALKKSGVPREDVFVTSKLTAANFGYDQAIRSFEESLAKLDFDYLDLFILHWPVEDLRIESYRALETLYRQGKIKAIGVSNFTIRHLETLMQATDIVPTVNQVEFSPYLYQKALHKFCKEQDVQIVAYCPLTKGEKLDDPKLVSIADKYKKSSAQVLLAWAIQHDIAVLTKSVKPSRIQENSEIFDFEISADDMRLLDAFDENLRLAWNPENVK